jgi:two-component system response regulator HydG
MSQPAHAARRHSILVVDDEPDTCANLSDILTDLGYEVDVAHDGPSALAKIAHKHYDIALLDVRMPGMDGLDLFRRIRAMRAGTVSIVVTAYASHETAQAALDAGVWKVVPKPVDFQKLLPLVEQATQQPLVLVVDDDPDLCHSLWDLLRERELRVCLAHDAAGAAHRLQSAAYQVVLVDLKLPDGDGAQVLQAVRQTNPQARTVLITGHRREMSHLIEQALTEGADAVCYKPFDVAQLLETVQRLAG